MSETGSRKSVIGAGATFTGKLVKASALDIHGEVNADVSTDRLHPVSYTHLRAHET